MKKVLIISFDSFNLSSSNGRSLGTLLSSFHELSISQIFIKPGNPDFISGEYCFIDENKLVKKSLSIKKCAKFFSYSKDSCLNESCTANSKIYNHHKKKSPFKMVCRNIAWSLASLTSKPIYKWAKTISPDYVLIQAGDLPFLLNLGFKIAKKCKSKIIFYSSENYPFKYKNYTNLLKKSFLYPFLRRKLFKATKKVAEASESSIFLTDSLKQEFLANFPKMKNAYVIYPCPEMSLLPIKKPSSKLVFSYCGNFGLGRSDTLIKIARILNSAYSNAIVVACGNCNVETIEKLNNESNIRYIGCLPYTELKKIYEDSDFLLHVEGFDELISEDSKHAFSGKIADCIATGRPFIFVGPSKLFEYQFLSETKTALVFKSIADFDNQINNGVLDNNSFNIENQINAKEQYFSKAKTYGLIKEIFGL